MSNDSHGVAFDSRALVPFADAARELVETMHQGHSLTVTMDDGRTVTLSASEREYMAGMRDALDVLTGRLPDMSGTPGLTAVRHRIYWNAFGDDE